ncbi:hypothetical protein A374_14375 [Fictibacillus macauensis ZFHKF-1]|uniref:Uncharacterized protein n=1 Tax=Fictibacillus macauensis ZFHKF-1 TaxID=1196324 RepID=I8UCM1_9BACL|nr:hypothetical protein [Fictibacillus macauensis]EIT84523.1 hypothetical protein A374_14375 [Fictibacillus macauensis ZFHKF-1]
MRRIIWGMLAFLSITSFILFYFIDPTSIAYYCISLVSSGFLGLLMYKEQHQKKRAKEKDY